MRRNKLPLLWTILVLTSLITCTGEAASNFCANGLGLENGGIKDEQIEASENTTSASGGRLNSPSSAWCFHYDKFIGQKAFFTVDLGSVQLISGFQSQGPPSSLFPREYLRYVGLEVEFSLDGQKWEQCCNGAKMAFYADDRGDKVDVVSTHSFKTVVASRHIRILASTDVRWIGEAEKCFRFEILGCNPDLITPEVNFTAISKPAGYLEASWNQPELRIAKEEIVTLRSKFFKVNVSHIEESLVLDEFNVSDSSLIVPRPQWDTTYTFNLECYYADFLDNLDCGRFEVKAVINVISKDCLSNLPTCPLEDRVQFMAPETLSALSYMNGSVLITWSDSSMGWKTSKRRVKVIDASGRILVTSLSKENENELIVDNLSSDQVYELVFAPEGPNIPDFTQEFSASLVLLPDADQLHRAFITSVGLSTAIIYSGQIRAFWNQAKAVREDLEGTLASTMADKYILILKLVQGETIEVLGNSTVSSSTFTYDFGGIEINTEYQIDLICVFESREFECGSSLIFSGQPLMVIEEEDSDAKVFVQSRIPRSWQDMESYCKSSNGHLVSLDSYDLEQRLTRTSTLEDFWCGGNMCKNSPAPAHSMWSDGSPQLNTNFAADSGLDGSHCCVKVESIDKELNLSNWKGESCKTILQGICEFSVDEYIDTPSDVYGQGISPDAVNISWSTDGLFWQPSEYKIEYCHLESLSKAALPIVGEKCKEITIPGHRGRHLASINHLEPFSEYQFQVIGSVEAFAKQPSTFAKARTMPKDDVEWVVTSSGILKLSWLAKIAEYKDNEKVKLVYRQISSNISKEAEGTAKEVKVDSLVFGETYEVTLIDLDTNQEEETFTFVAYPNCTLGLRQNMSCNFVSDEEMSFVGANEKCNDLGMLGQKNLGMELAQVDWESLTNDSMIWIGNQEPRNGKEETSTSRVTKAVTSNDNLGYYCQAWSIRRLDFQTIPCDSELAVFCQADLIIETPAPSKTTLKVVPGPTHITIDWNVPQEGWTTSYKIQVIPAKAANKTRSERADNLTSSLLFVNQNGTVEVDQPREIEFSESRPPINITNLEPDTEYNFVITTSLNPKWKTTLNLDEIATTANNSFGPEGIIGFTVTSAEYKAAELSIFSIIMALIALSIAIFVISGTIPVYADNAVQVCFEVSLLSCHIFTLLGFLDGPLAWNPADQTKCVVALVAFSYLSLCAFIFLFLESLCIANHLMEAISLKVLENIRLLVAGGFFAPILYLAIIIPTLYEDLIPFQRKVCWLNLDSPESASIIVPIVILISLTLLVLLTVILGSSSTEELQSADHLTNRTQTLQKNRFIMLAITSLASLGWIFGITSAHFQEAGLIITFLIVHLALAIVIFGLRCIMDEQALRLFRRMCHEPYVPKVSSASSATKMIDEPAATYTSPFGEDNGDAQAGRPQTRAKSRTNPRTPYVQSAPQLTHNQAKRPRSRRKVSAAAHDNEESGENPASNSTTFHMFLSLPNTPDTEDPLRSLRTKPTTTLPVLGAQSYI